MVLHSLGCGRVRHRRHNPYERGWLIRAGSTSPAFWRLRSTRSFPCLRLGRRSPGGRGAGVEEKDLRSLLDKLTVEEKARLLTGADRPRTCSRRCYAPTIRYLRQQPWVVNSICVNATVAPVGFPPAFFVWVGVEGCRWRWRGGSARSHSEPGS